jgi:hypothetical protein
MRGFWDLLPKVALAKRNLAVISVLIAITLPAAIASYAETPRVGGLNDRHALGLYQAIKDRTAKDDRILFVKARSLALLTGRKSFHYSRSSPDILFSAICSAAVTHVVYSPSLFPMDETYLTPLLNQFTFELIYENPSLRLYKLKSECRNDKRAMVVGSPDERIIALTPGLSSK